MFSFLFLFFYYIKHNTPKVNNFKNVFLKNDSYLQLNFNTLFISIYKIYYNANTRKKKDFKDCARKDLCSYTITSSPGRYPIVLRKRL